MKNKIQQILGGKIMRKSKIIVGRSLVSIILSICILLSSIMFNPIFANASNYVIPDYSKLVIDKNYVMYTPGEDANSRILIVTDGYIHVDYHYVYQSDVGGYVACSYFVTNEPYRMYNITYGTSTSWTEVFWDITTYKYSFIFRSLSLVKNNSLNISGVNYEMNSPEGFDINSYFYIKKVSNTEIRIYVMPKNTYIFQSYQMLLLSQYKLMTYYSVTISSSNTTINSSSWSAPMEEYPRQSDNALCVATEAIYCSYNYGSSMIKKNTNFFLPLNITAISILPTHITDFIAYSNYNILDDRSNELVFEANVFTQKEIPDNAVSFNGNLYNIYNMGMTWSEAKEYCIGLGGHLVTITTQEERDFISNLIETHGTKSFYWLWTPNKFEEESGVWIVDVLVGGFICEWDTDNIINDLIPSKFVNEDHMYSTGKINIYKGTLSNGKIKYFTEDDVEILLADDGTIWGYSLKVNQIAALDPVTLVTEVVIVAVVVYTFENVDVAVISESLIAIGEDIYDSTTVTFKEIKEKFVLLLSDIYPEIITNVSEGIKDIRKNTSNWEMTNRIVVPATSGKAPDGISIEEEWTHTSGFKMYKHDVQTVDGKSIDGHPHWRGYSKPNGD